MAIRFEKLDTVKHDGYLSSKEIDRARKMGVTKDLWIGMTENDYYGGGTYEERLETAKNTSRIMNQVILTPLEKMMIFLTNT